MWGEQQFWGPHEDKVLADMWKQGFVTREIGERLGKTRDAVIGRAHRLNLPKRESPIKRAS